MQRKNKNTTLCSSMNMAPLLVFPYGCCLRLEAGDTLIPLVAATLLHTPATWAKHLRSSATHQAPKSVGWLKPKVSVLCIISLSVNCKSYDYSSWCKECGSHVAFAHSSTLSTLKVFGNFPKSSDATPCPERGMTEDTLCSKCQVKLVSGQLLKHHNTVVIDSFWMLFLYLIGDRHFVVFQKALVT